MTDPAHSIPPVTALYRLVYVSRNAIDGDEAARQREVAAILATARRRNLADGISGALLFNNACFVQVLEGELGRIEATFERIERDPRHADVAVIEFEPAGARRFARRSMGYVGASAAQGERFRRLAGAIAIDPATLDADELVRALGAVLRERETAPL